MYVYDKFGIKRKFSDFTKVEKLYKLKAKSGSNPWPVIEEILKIWETKAKEQNQWNSYLFNLESIRETRRDEFASSKADPVHGGILRYILDIPEFVHLAIRILYSPDELPMNKQFNEEFARRYPSFKVAQKI